MQPERLGKYELIRHLASGGMARVYLARVSGVGGFERHVVLKTVRPERTEDQSYVTMFLDEARLVATLHHQHIAQVYEVGVADDGTYFLAMEYLHGETVRTVLEQARARRYRLPFDFALTIVCAAASGLHHAHERRGSDGTPLGIVHRDVSPSNVIIGYDGSIKLIDFGIAKAEDRTTKTQTGFVKGKAGYMAPEQALGYPVDRRSDVFALGVVLYELTTQARAFRAASEYEAVQRIVSGDLARPTSVMADYPTELEDVVMTALETDPDDRFQDADAMRRALEMTAQHLGYGLGQSVVSRVLVDLCGVRPEPWLAKAALDVDEATVVDVESAPMLAIPPPRARTAPPVAAVRAQPPASVHVESEEAATGRFMMVDSELPPPAIAPVVPVMQVARPVSIPPPVPPRVATGSTPPPSRLPTVNLRVTPPPRPAPTMSPLVNDPPTPPASRARGTLSDMTPVVDLRTGKHAARIALAVGIAVFAVGLIAMIASEGDEAEEPRTAEAQPPAKKPVAMKSSTPPAPTTSTSTPTTTSTSTSTPSTTPAPEAAKQYVTLRVTSDPVGASVVLDGVKIGKTPFVGTLPAGPREAVLKVRMRDRITRKMTIKLDQDITWDIELPLRE